MFYPGWLFCTDAPFSRMGAHVTHTKQRRTHICIVGMIFYRYLAWKCKHLRLSITRLVDVLDGIRLALVQEKDGRNVKMMVEEMDAKQARLFSLLDLGKFMVS